MTDLPVNMPRGFQPSEEEHQRLVSWWHQNHTECCVCGDEDDPWWGLVWPDGQPNGEPEPERSVLGAACLPCASQQAGYYPLPEEEETTTVVIGSTLTRRWTPR